MNKKIYYVDVPNHASTCDDDAWVNIAITKTLKEAEALLMDRYGIKLKDSDVFITAGRL